MPAAHPTIADQPVTTGNSTATGSTRPLRRDAAQNRARLLDAARSVFAERGIEASVDEISRAAGVGMGTLYRRFPTKQALIDELVGSMRLELLELARQALNRVDGRGLESLLLDAGGFQARQPSCLQQLWSSSDAQNEAMVEFRAITADLLRRAQRSGRVRADVSATDISLVFWSTRSIIETTRSAAPDAWRRHLELLVAGLRPHGSSRAVDKFTEAPLTPEQVQACVEAARR